MQTRFPCVTRQIKSLSGYRGNMRDSEDIFFIIFHFQRVDEWKKIFNTNIAKIFHPGPLFIGALVWFWRHILYHISFSTGGWMKKYIQHNIAKIFHPGPVFTGALVWFWNIFFIIFHFQRVDEWKKIFSTNIAKTFNPGPLFNGALV